MKPVTAIIFVVGLLISGYLAWSLYLAIGFVLVFTLDMVIFNRSAGDERLRLR